MGARRLRDPRECRKLQVVTTDDKSPAPGAVAATNRLDQLWGALRESRVDPARHLGEALVERGLLDVGQLSQLLERQAHMLPHHSLGRMLVEEGVIAQDRLNAVIGEWLGLRYVDLAQLTPEPEALQQVPAAFARRERVLPLMVRDGSLVVALEDPWDGGNVQRQLRFLTGLQVRTVVAAPGGMAAALGRAYAAPPAPPPQAAHRTLDEIAAELAEHDTRSTEPGVELAAESDSVLVQLVHRIIAQAIEQRASDIHIEAAEAPQSVKVRLRIDGELRDLLELPSRYGYALVSRLKIMADLDIAEHRKPQDGKIDFARFGGAHVELRMVTVPTVHGLEDVVLRLLGGMRPRALDAIDLAGATLSGLREAIHRPYGLILICGPTGSGKTTTLHSVMRELNDGRRKIWTAEDPVEITQPGLRQVQVNSRIGWTFAAAMRTFLRADPDIIMIGEMRDEETARIAIEAALTGHLVMSTLHTNSAAESITRLLEIGLDPFTFSDTLLAVLAQRLVRRLCPHCRQRLPMDDATLRQLAELHGGSGIVEQWRARHGDAEGRLWQWRRGACAQCEGSGYHGRLGVHELLLADDALRELVRHRAPMRELVTLGQSRGMATLRQDGIDKVLQGLTDLPEVLAATQP